MEGRKTEKVVLCGSDSCFLACYHFIDCKSNLVLVKKAQRLSAPVLLTILPIYNDFKYSSACFISSSFPKLSR